jgi:hypothetical protein
VRDADQDRRAAVLQPVSSRSRRRQQLLCGLAEADGIEDNLVSLLSDVRQSPSRVTRT